jgi:LysR family carnitine catabolism transcriptional activator
MFRRTPMMNIKYRQLKAFSLAARLGSFAKAAAAMCVTQPSFSVLIRELEHDLGMPLFERTTRSCALTPAGLTLFRDVEPVLHDLQEAYHHAKETGAGRRGCLSMAAIPSLAFGIITEVLGGFHKVYPDVRIQMREELNMSVIKAVKQNEVELGIGCQLNADSEVAFMPLFHDVLMMFAAKDHPAWNAPVTWQTIEEYPLILLGLGSAERALQQCNPGLAAAFEVAHMGTAMGMARHGMGITVLPSSGLDGLNTEGLRWTPMPGEMGRRCIGVLHRKRKTLSASALAFIDMLRAAVPADSEAEAEVY